MAIYGANEIDILDDDSGFLENCSHFDVQTVPIKKRRLIEDTSVNQSCEIGESKKKNITTTARQKKPVKTKSVSSLLATKKKKIKREKKLRSKAKKHSVIVPKSYSSKDGDNGNVAESNVVEQTRREPENVESDASNNVSDNENILPQKCSDGNEELDDKIIYEKLKEGEMKLVPRKTKTGKITKSKGWKYFKCIIDCNTNKILEYKVFCTRCVQLFR